MNTICQKNTDYVFTVISTLENGNNYQYFGFEIDCSGSFVMKKLKAKKPKYHLLEI